MKAVRVAVVVLVALATALPAAARPPAELVRVSTFLPEVEVSGLADGDSARVEALWEEFVAGTPAHAACLVASPPRVVARADMAPRAAYAPGSQTLYVKPGDLDRLVVFHELAHHLDFTCGAADTIGEAVRRAQGISPSRAWWNEGDPVTWPAEYFANAVAIALGETSRHGVTGETVAVVEEWMGQGADRAGVEAAPASVLAIDDFGTSVPRLS